MANTLKFKRGLVSGIPTAALGEPLFTTDTFDLYIGNGTTNTRFQKYIASGATTQILRGDGSLYSFPLNISSATTNQILRFDGTNWVNSNETTGSGTVTSVALATGTSGTDVNVSGSPITSSGTITINIPDASTTARGLVTTASQTFVGQKTFNNSVIISTASGGGIGLIVDGTSNSAGFLAIKSNASGYSYQSTGYVSITSSQTDYLSISYQGATKIANFIGSSLTAIRNYTLPNASGTLALTSDIPSVTNIYNSDGTLSGNRTVTLGSNILTFSSANSSTTGGGLVVSTSNAGVALDVFSTNSIAARLISIAASQGAVSNVLQIGANTLGVANQNGLGSQIQYRLSTSINGLNSDNTISNNLISRWTDYVDSTRTSEFVIQGVNSATIADLFTLSGNGRLKLNKYGVNTFTGTAAYNIAVDSSGNLIETAFSSGTVTSVAIATGTSGSDVNISGSPITSSGTITINIPSASTTARGLVTTAAQSFDGVKTFAGTSTIFSNLIDLGSYIRIQKLGLGSGTPPSGKAYIWYNDTTNTLYFRNDANVEYDLTSSSTSVPLTRTLTINGTSYDLSANRSWSVGTVTSVGLTSSTSGVTITGSPVTSSGNLNFEIATASGSANGLLSSTDWATFNNKFTLPSLTSGSVLFSNGTTISQDNSNFFWDNTNKRLGIGTASPNAPLTVVTNTAAQGINIFGRSTDNYGVLRFQSNTGASTYATIYSNASDLLFEVAGSEAARITSSRNFHIGTFVSDSGEKLQVSGSMKVTGAATFTQNANNYVNIFSSGTFDSGVSFGNGTTNKWYLYKGNDDRFEIYSVGKTGGGGSVMQIAYTGAATFSSSVTASAYYINSSNQLLSTDAGDIRIWQRANLNVQFLTNDLERMRLTANGRLLLGTTTEGSELLQVAGTSKFTDALSGTSATFSSTVQGTIITATSYFKSDAYRDSRAETLISYQGSNHIRIGSGDASDYLTFYAGSAQKLIIASTGAATFSSSATATAFIPSGSSVPTNGMYLSAANTLDFATNSANRLTISSTGVASFSNRINETRIDPRSITTTSTATLTPDVSTDDFFTVTAQAATITLANPTGTPVEGQKIIVRIKDDGTARSILYGTQYRGSTDLALPTTTTLSKTIYLGFIYNSTDTKWDLLCKLDNF